MFGSTDMKIIEQDAVYYIKSKNVDDDIKKVIDSFYINLRNLFSDTRIGANAIILSNNILSYVFRWNLIDLISSAEISVEPKKNYFILRTKISFSKWIILNLIIAMFIFLSMLSEADAIFFSLISAILLLGVTYIFAQISGIRFGSIIVDCVKKTGLEIN